MQTLKLQAEETKYDITGFGYVCQICGYKVETRPPEWCPRCGYHKVLFKKTPNPTFHT